MVGGPKRGLSASRKYEIDHLSVGGDEIRSSEEREIDTPIKSGIDIGQKFIMAPSQAACWIERMQHSPAIFETCSGKGPIGDCAVAAKGIQVEVAAKQDCQGGCRWALE